MRLYLLVYSCKTVVHNQTYSHEVVGRPYVVVGRWCQDELGCAHHCQSTVDGMVCACRKGYRLHSDGRDCIRE